MHCLPPSPQWTVAWGTRWEKMWFWDPLKIHLFPITLNSENFSSAKNITVAFVHLFLGLFDSFLPSAMKALRTMVSTCFHVSSAWPEEWVILQFRREQCLFSFTSVPKEPKGSGFGPLRQESPGMLFLLKSHWPLLTDWESELRFLSAQFRGRDVQKPRGYFTLCSPCLFLPPP